MVPAVAIALLIAATRFWARQKTFWEWDDFIFGSSLHAFAPLEGFPQAPFYPGFVALGRLARAFLRDDVAALTFVSAASSCVAALAVFGIARQLLCSLRAAAGAAILFAFFPAVWFHAGAPLSDDAGLAVSLCALWAALAAGRRERWLLPAAVLLGLAVSVRPQDAVIAVPALILAARGERRVVRTGALATATALLAYALPVAVAAGGIRPAWSLFRHQTGYVVATDSLVAPGRSAWFSLRRYGAAIWVTHGLAAVILLLSLAGAVLLLREGKGRVLAIAAASFVPYAALCFLFLDPTVAGRYSLPFLPLPALLVAHAAEKLERLFVPWRAPAATAAVALLSAAAAAPAIRVLHTRPSPPVEAAGRLREMAGGIPAIVALEPDYRVAAARLLPGARLIQTHDPQDPRLRAETGPVWVFGLPAMGADWPEVAWPKLAAFTTVGRGRYLSVACGRWRLPSFLFGKGWYQEELDRMRDGTVEPFRWMAQRSEMRMAPCAGPTSVRFALVLPPGIFRDAPVVRLRLDQAPPESFLLDRETVEKEYRIPSAADGHEIAIETSETFVPAERGRGADRRPMGLQIRRVKYSGCPARQQGP